MNRESLSADVGRPDAVLDRRIVYIEQTVAPLADEVVVALRPRIHPGGRTRAARLGEDPEPHECLEDPVDRSARDAGERVLHRRVDLVRRGMVGPPEEGLEDPAALHGDWEPLGPAGRLELPYGDRLRQHRGILSYTGRAPADRVRRDRTNGNMYHRYPSVNVGPRPPQQHRRAARGSGNADPKVDPRVGASVSPGAPHSGCVCGAAGPRRPAATSRRPDPVVLRNNSVHASCC